MLPHHTLDISVRPGGEIKVEVHYKGRVPNLLERFSRDVQLKARNWLQLPSAYERKLWRAARGMPFWARETIRQHILQERAERISARMQRVAENREEKIRRRAARVVAVRKVTAALGSRLPTRAAVPEVKPIVVQVPVAAPTLTSRLSGSALGPVPPQGLSLTEQLGQIHGVPLAVPPKVVRHHGRDR